MNQLESLHYVKDQLPLSYVQDVSYQHKGLFRESLVSNSSLRMMEQSVNNYLKTPEEMEAEFCFVINSRRAAYDEMDDRYDTYGRITKKTDGYMNIHNLDETLSGYMEENY